MLTDPAEVVMIAKLTSRTCATRTAHASVSRPSFGTSSRGDIRGKIERAIRGERDTKAPSFLETDDKYANQLLDTVNRWRLKMLGVTTDEPAEEIGR